MTNPFEDDTAEYLALVNDEGHYSLWPAAIDVPQGWRTALGPAPRQECLDHVSEVWTDMRPASVAGQMDGATAR